MTISNLPHAALPESSPQLISRANLAGLLLLLTAFYYTNLHSFLLFHSLVELFSILVFFGIFVIAWNARKIISNHYLLFLGIAYLFIGVMDLEHTLAYKGMGLLGHDGDANHATQLWIAARYTESLSLLAAPFFLQRRLRPRLLLTIFTIGSFLVLWAIHAGFFPDCYIEGSGLTRFKIISEYVISAILLTGFIVLRRHRHLLDGRIYQLLAVSILFTIASELSFTFYIGVFDFSNLIGHFCKAISAFLIYVALIESGLKNPYSLLFHELTTNQSILAAREAEFRSMFETSAVGMAKIDAFSRQFILVNRQFCRITGYEPEELLQMQPSDLTHPQDRERDLAAFDTFRRDATADYRIEKRYIRKDGSVIWVQVTASMISNEDGQPQYSLGIIRDVTALRRDQELLRLSEERFRSTFENAAVGIAHVSLKGDWLRVNDRLCRILGYSREQLLTATFQSITHQDDLAAELAQAERLISGETDHYTMEKRYIRQDGHIVWTNLTGSLQRDDAGTPLYFIAIVEDISPRKKIEQDLRASEEKFRQISQSIKDVIWMSTPGLDKMIYINPAYEEVWGRSRESLYRNPLSFREAIHPEDIHLLENALEMHAQGKWHFHYRIIRPDGSVRWIEDSGSPIYDETGMIQLMTGVARDITSRKLLEEQNRQKKEELEREVALRTAELANSVEQLRTLAMQISEAENRERRRLAEILHDDLQQLLAAARIHINRLLDKENPDIKSRMTVISDILKKATDTSRSLSHDLSPAILYRGSLKAILEWLADRKQKNYGLAVKVDMHEDLDVQSDILRVFIYRALQELLFNIVKHAGTLEATLAVDLQGDEILRISVSDHGCGFNPDELTGPGARSREVGLGLFSIRERLILLGGSLSIHSRPGQGSRFIMRLPLQQENLEKPPQTSDPYPAAADPSGGDPPSPARQKPHEDKRIRVLLADDHDTIRQGLEALLKDEKDVTVVGLAATGIEAVRLTAKLQPHVVIMDMSMPGMDGIEATVEIVKKWPQVAVVIHSMHENREVEQAALKAGARAYCTKSGSTAELLNAIRTYGGG